jgi:hypothetical protein
MQCSCQNVICIVIVCVFEKNRFLKNIFFNVLGYTLGVFFTNSSGHPAAELKNFLVEKGLLSLFWEALVHTDTFWFRKLFLKKLKRCRTKKDIQKRIEFCSSWGEEKTSSEESAAITAQKQGDQIGPIFDYWANVCYFN